MKQKKLIILMMLMTLSAGVLAGCKTEATPSPEQVLTEVGLTVQADLTQIAQSQPTATPTEAPTATPTVEPTSETPQVTTSPVSQVSPTTAVVVGGTNAGVWVKSDPADGTKVQVNEKFSVVVSLMNTGTSTWTTDYYVQYASGEKMVSTDPIYLPYDVPPGKMVDISIKFTAPSVKGTYRSDFYIYTSADLGFYTFYCEYKVTE